MATAETQVVDRILESRRAMLAAGGAALAALVFAPKADAQTAAAPIGDNDILNFALNLEYLEAEFYLHAATGSGLSATDSGNATSKTVIGGSTQVPGLTTIQSQYIYEIAQNELDHVRFLRAALGSAAVAAPAIDLTNSFNTLAAAATIGSTFNPFSSYSNYLIGAFIFEDVGVTAYHGAARYLTSTSNLTAAAEIHAVEAYHAASIRTQIVAAGSTLIGYANLVQNVRSTLGSGNETTLTATAIVAAAANTSIGFERSTDAVLHIVYGTGGGAGVKSGVFFPSGFNGNISVTLS